MKIPYLLLFFPGILFGQTLFSPKGGVHTLHPHPHFSWTPMIELPAANMPETEIQIAKDPCFKEIVDEDSVAAVIQRYVPATPLELGEYFWRVRHVPRGKEPLPWIQPGRFKVIQPAKTYLVPAGANKREIQHYLQMAQENRPARLLFEKGTWNVYSGDAFFHLKRHKGIVIDGNGATLKLVGYGSFMNLQGCQNIVVKGFNIEFLDVSHIAGKILAADMDLGTIDIELLPGYPTLEEVPLIADHTEGMLRRGGKEFGTKEQFYGDVDTKPGFEKLRDGVYRLHVPKKDKITRNFQLGDVYIKGPLWQTGFNIHNSQDVSISGCTMSMCPGTGFNTTASDRLRILDFQFTRKEGHPIAIQGDVHRHQHARVGPWIENCTVDNSGYNLCKVYGRAFTLRGRPAADKVVLDASVVVRTGEKLIFYDKTAGRIISRRKVVGIGPKKDGKVTLTLESPPGNLKVGQGNPQNTQGTVAYNLNRQGNQFVWRNNTSVGTQRAGLQCSGNRGLVEKNTFQDMGESAVELRNVHAYGFFTSNYVIRGNRFKECGLVKTKSPNFGIQHKGKVNPQLMHRNILVENNEFIDYPNRAMHLTSTKGLVVRGNRISNMRFDKFKDGAFVIEAKNCPDLVLEGNRVDDSRALPESAVLVRKDSSLQK